MDLWRNATDTLPGPGHRHSSGHAAQGQHPPGRGKAAAGKGGKGPSHTLLPPQPHYGGGPHPRGIGMARPFGQEAMAPLQGPMPPRPAHLFGPRGPQPGVGLMPRGPGVPPGGYASYRGPPPAGPWLTGGGFPRGQLTGPVGPRPRPHPPPGRVVPGAPPSSLGGGRGRWSMHPPGVLLPGFPGSGPQMPGHAPGGLAMTSRAGGPSFPPPSGHKTPKVGLHAGHCVDRAVRPMCDWQCFAETRAVVDSAG